MVGLLLYAGSLSRQVSAIAYLPQLLSVRIRVKIIRSDPAYLLIFLEKNLWHTYRMQSNRQRYATG